MDGIARAGLARLHRPGRPRLPERPTAGCSCSTRKISMSFSALLFGPFYFFYRKAWKPAFAFWPPSWCWPLPTLWSMMQAHRAARCPPALSTSTLVLLARVCSVLSFLLMMVRGLYGKWLYRQSAASRIRRIRSPSSRTRRQRQAVLAAQGGVSFGPPSWVPLCC